MANENIKSRKIAKNYDLSKSNLLGSYDFFGIYHFLSGTKEVVEHPINSLEGIGSVSSAFILTAYYGTACILRNYKRECHLFRFLITGMEIKKDELDWLIGYYSNKYKGIEVAQDFFVTGANILILKKLRFFRDTTWLKKMLKFAGGGKGMESIETIPIWFGTVMYAIVNNKFTSTDPDMIMQEVAYMIVTGDYMLRFFESVDKVPTVFNGVDSGYSIDYRIISIKYFLALCG